LAAKLLFFLDFAAFRGFILRRGGFAVLPVWRCGCASFVLRFRQFRAAVMAASQHGSALLHRRAAIMGVGGWRYG